MVDGRIVAKFLSSAVADMFQNNRKEIRCPCRKCKQEVLIDPFLNGHLKAHLLMFGFMDGYTRRISEDGINGAENNEREDNNGPEEGWNDDAPEHGEDAEHGEEVGQLQPPSLSSIVQDPHLRDLLRKKTTNTRAASREEAKLTQLE